MTGWLNDVGLVVMRFNVKKIQGNAFWETKSEDKLLNDWWLWEWNKYRKNKTRDGLGCDFRSWFKVEWTCG